MNKKYFLFKGYIGEFEIVDDHRSGKVVVNLNGRLNKVNEQRCKLVILCIFYF